MAATAPAESSAYAIKRVEFFGRTAKICLQNRNGPCPLLALANVLSLRNELKLPAGSRSVSQGDLITAIVDQLLERSRRFEASPLAADAAQNVADAFPVLQKLTTGIDVNVKFTSPHAFEPTPEVAVFDLLGITLVHGWMVDPVTEPAAAAALGSRSYNEVMELLASGLGSPVTSGGGGCAGGPQALVPPTAAAAAAGDAAPPAAQSAAGRPTAGALGGAALVPVAAAGPGEQQQAGGGEDEAIEQLMTAMMTQLSDDQATTTAAITQVASSPQQLGDSSSLARASAPPLLLLLPESAPAAAAAAPPPAAAATGGGSGATAAAAAATTAAAVAAFLSEHCSQLTPHGLAELTQQLHEHQLAVFFRNNHFATVFKFEDALYLLVTDAGYEHESDVVWERLDCVQGDTTFCTASFSPFVPHAEAAAAPGGASGDAALTDLDAAIAASLAAVDDDSSGGGGAASGDAAAATHIDGGLQADSRNNASAVGHQHHADADYALALQLHLQEEEAAAERQRAAEAARQQQQQQQPPGAALAAGMREVGRRLADGADRAATSLQQQVAAGQQYMQQQQQQQHQRRRQQQAAGGSGGSGKQEDKCCIM